ncbi:5-(carboxyamino)imidazole ribonucleotide synthase [Ahniella affigens]|uniref:N5-carboxyaminoimidazole ribonucleotide synthase n=1 Tax=Ahniella affigens TaxID=2021234 RepID=A0A2P1PMA8_9GAMM|nr:5-(carboxyamino)imidazole ribonucleotide synthase [Ahniella affigens]AVP95962.1 5-(carboxyamino)imidazole ribonucleotide synthase [Ahniella affigens]
MTRVGILGGGQLARMMALAGAPLGLHFRVLDVSPEACAAQFAPLIVADYTDREALARFAEQVDVVTFDFENVPAESAQFLAERLPVFPNPKALAIAQDRLHEKTLFRELGLGTPAFAAVDSLADLRHACAEIGFPCVLKTRRLGYDGKGQYRLKSEADIEPAFAELGRVPLILEAFVHFRREVSVVAVRSRLGAFSAYPLTQNWHADGILSASLAPAPHAERLAARAFAAAQKLADQLNYVGVFALELFDIGDDQFLVNEMAPRVHNSGHWTQEGALTSQFANHLRAVVGLPLGSTELLAPTVMLNWVGTLPAREPVLAYRRGYFHDYGKSPRAGRKVGHANIVADNLPQLADALASLGQALDRETQIAPVLQALRS